MDRLKKRLSRSRSNDSVASSAGSTVSKVRGRRGGLAAFHFKKANFSKELALALKTGDVTKLRELLEGGSEIEDFEEVEKAVKICCEKGHLELLATLIRFGASVNTLGENSQGPLHVAVRHGSLSVITLLISNGANMNIQTKFEKRTPAHVAALSGKEDSMKLLIEASKTANLDPKDIYGTTPLHLAARMGHVDIVRLLLNHKRKCDVNSYDNEGWTALHLAAERGDTEMAQLLLDRFAQVDCQNKYGRTPLHWATIKGNPIMVQFLIQNEASTTIKDLHGKRAMQYATDTSVKQILKTTNSIPSKPITVENSIGTLVKIDPRESFIRRLAHPLPNVISPVASIKKKGEISQNENLDTIVEETEAGSSSRKSSILSEDEAFASDESVTKERSPFIRAIFQRKNSNDGSSATSSRRNSTNSRSDLESSYKSTGSTKVDPLSKLTVGSLEKVPSMKSIAQSWMSQDIEDNDNESNIPEEALLGKAQFKTMMSRIHRHQQAVENIINSISTEVAQAVTGRKNLTDEDLLNFSNRLHKVQDMMFDFREENERQSALMKTTMQSFLDTIKQRLSPRDPVPLWIIHSFLHACVVYLSTKQNGWKQIIQRTLAISEEKKSDMLTTGNKMSDSSGMERSSLVIQFAVKSLLESDCNKNTPLKALLLLMTKCAFEPNSAQIILKKFMHTARPSPEECLQHDNLFALSYRLGKDGDALGNHLGVSVKDTDNNNDNISQCHRQEQNLRTLSKWRQASAKVAPLECAYDLVEGLVVIGREDLLVWILSSQKKRTFSSESESTC